MLDFSRTSCLKCGLYPADHTIKDTTCTFGMPQTSRGATKRTRNTLGNQVAKSIEAFALIARASR